MWCIGIKTAHFILKATTNQCIGTTGQLAKHFKTDKAQLW